ncbi:hypothetical protein C8Q74DRAFT_1301323 [Fomes fomentarius]|nr:hypothetical protein C8Q74DRAFT_1301323 [Fomes fomentarius]
MPYSVRDEKVVIGYVERARRGFRHLRRSGIQRRIVQDNPLRDEDVRYSPSRMNEDGLGSCTMSSPSSSRSRIDVCL